MAYRVPPKQIVVHRGRTYGAGDVIQGYTPPKPKSSRKSSKSKTVEPEVKPVAEEPKADVDVNTITGEE